MAGKRILAVDYDGTFKQSGQVFKQNIKAAEKFRQAGNILVLNTGRNYIDAVAAADECGVKFDYICPLCGSMICDGKSHSVISEVHAQMNDFPGITNRIIEMNPHFIRRYYLKCGMFLRLGNNQYEEEYKGFSGCSKNEFKDNSIPFSLLICRFESHTAAEKAADELCKIYRNGLIYSHERFIDILPEKGGKAFALKKLADLIGVTKNNIYAIGDSCVDLQMITEFNGFFVDTAPESLIKKSDGAYKDVASLIEDILLNKI